jgi:hypothetical protein
MTYLMSVSLVGKFGADVSLSLSRAKVYIDKPHKPPCDSFLSLSVEFEVAISSFHGGKF